MPRRDEARSRSRCPRRRATWARRAVAGAMLTGSLAAAGCSAGAGVPQPTPPLPGHSLSEPAGQPVHGGTVMWAQQATSAPNYIFPIVSVEDFSNANTEEFSQLMYRPLYWFGTNGSPTVDLARSVGRRPVFSDGDTTVTVTLNRYRWSDGETVDARDVVFFVNLLKVEKQHFGGYVEGYFPDNLRRITMPRGPTGNVVTLHLEHRVNPTWFLYNQLSLITPMPIAWDRSSLRATPPTPTQPDLPDTSPARARAVYGFLDRQSKDLGSYATSPLWSDVDGPWRLSAFTSDGQATFVPNAHYVGPDHPYLSKFVEVPYTSDTAEFNTLASHRGGLQVGYVPPQDQPRLRTLEAGGLRALSFYGFGTNYLQLNFHSAAAGALLRQLYIRQALQSLIDQRGWIHAYYSGLGAPNYGPVPTVPRNSFAAAGARSNPYPFSADAAARLLTRHGWTVHPQGQTTCATPRLCGPGIARGAQLRFRLDVGSGNVATTSSMNDLVAEGRAVGIRLALVQQPGSTVGDETVSSSRTWDISNYGFGDAWVFGPDYYPSGEVLFKTGGADNNGSYSDARADRLIARTTSIGGTDSRRALNRYQSYIQRQLPVLFQPRPATEVVVAHNLGGTVLRPNAFLNIDPESWYYVRPGPR